jgi:hypothetical protein
MEKSWLIGMNHHAEYGWLPDELLIVRVDNCNMTV